MSYERYFKDNEDKWMEIDREKREKDRLKKNPEGMMKEDSRLITRNNFIEKEKDNILSNFILKYYPLHTYSSWKEDNKNRKYQYI
jgi:hypothetical protein